MARWRRALTLLAVTLTAAACASGRAPAPQEATGSPVASAPPAPTTRALPPAGAGEEAAASSEAAAATGPAATVTPGEAAGVPAAEPSSPAPEAAALAAADPAASASGGFETSVRPILQAKCSPCHFEGGKMYDKLPFDSPETIMTLGERLFTRIRDENERAAIRSFLSTAADPRSP